MTLAEVHDACLECSAGQSYLTTLPSNAISLGNDADALLVISAAFQAEAAATSEPDDAMRYTAIADQLLGTPADRVLHFRYPNGTAVGNYYVALRSDAVADDGYSPLAVVISSKAGGSGINTIDQLILLDSWRAFQHALDPTAEPPDDADDDDDRVRDIHETGSGGFTSRTDTGTDPVRPDTDGDLYFDWTEIAGGANPNDSSSFPIFAPAIDALTTWQGAVLVVLPASEARSSPRAPASALTTDVTERPLPELRA